MEQIKRVDTTMALTKEQLNEKLTSLGVKLYTTYLLADIIDSYYVDILSGLKAVGQDMKYDTKYLYNKLLQNIKQSRSIAKQITEQAYKKDFEECFVATSDDLVDLISAFLMKTGNDRKRVEMVMKNINKYKDVV